MGAEQVGRSGEHHREVDVPQADRDAIFSGNALRIMNNVTPVVAT